MKSAIEIENVSKRYRLGARGNGYRTLRESIMDGASAGLKKIKKITGANGHGAGDNGSDILWALKDVSFQVKPGEAIGILGRNGAGKSTLLKILSRITPPTDGRIGIRGRVGSLLEVGTGFHPELTGRENIFLNGAIIGMSKKEIERKFDAIVEFAEMGKFIDTPVKRYSSGMYVRLAFSVAAHMEPDILLVDEVLSVGDAIFQRKCLDHAKKVLRTNATLLFVSHNMFAIKAMCDRAIYLSQGQVIYDGPTADAIARYENDVRLTTASWAESKIGSDPNRYPIRMTAVEVLDEGGEAQTVFDYGQRMRLRLHYVADRRIERPNFNVSFVRSDNIPVCNYNMAMDAIDLPFVEGEGVVEVLTPPMKLVAEMYSVHTMVWDQKFQSLYCAQVGQNFHIRHEQLNTDFGIFHEEAEWSCDAAVTAGA
ncbi:MAG TPA: ABC transporter ATP-binding protein [Tepidisphaeraceae bacterium]|jgi:lipopolysaccharide transport system ATP-binding protein